MVSVPCCPEDLPDELFATIVGEADCPCALGAAARLRWNGARWAGSTPMGTCGNSISYELYCDGGGCEGFRIDYSISGGGSSPGEIPGQLCTCDPLLLDFQWGMLDTDCNTDVAAAIAVAITGTPYPHPLPPPTRPCERMGPEGCCPEPESTGGGPPRGAPIGGRTPSGSQPPAFSRAPVRYATGEVFVSAIDIESRGFGVPWGHTRRFSSRLSENTNFGNGANWVVIQWPYLSIQDDGTAVAFGIADSELWFDKSNGAYTPCRTCDKSCRLGA